MYIYIMLRTLGSKNNGINAKISSLNMINQQFPPSGR